MTESRLHLERPDEGRYIAASIVFIERDEIVPIPMRVLTYLTSFALAGPSNDASRRLRDEAIEGQRTAILAHFDALYPDVAAEDEQRQTERITGQ